MLQPVSITSLSGCDGLTSSNVNGIPTLTGCLPVGTVVISGSNIPVDGSLDIHDSSLVLFLPVSLNRTSTYITAQLPGLTNATYIAWGCSDILHCPSGRQRHQ